MEFIIEKHAGDLSVELFKKEYDYDSRDLLDEMEPALYFLCTRSYRMRVMPYLALFWFAEGNPRRAPVSLIFKDWESASLQEKFKELMERNFPMANFADVSYLISKLYLKSSLWGKLSGLLDKAQ